MLKNLRLRLTLLYLLVAMLLVGVLGGSSYSVLYFYFRDANDQALNTKMALVLDDLGAQVPQEFVEEQENYEGEEREEEHEESHEAGHNEELYEGELSSVFVLPLNAAGELLFNPNPYALPMQPDAGALEAALTNGSDYRTVDLIDGSPARLLTYAVPAQVGVEVLQVGKSIGDQATILRQFLTSLLVIGAVATVVLGLSSWWVAGRSLASHEKAWENQQAFIANASHELRTPLTLIRASAEAAQRRTMDNAKIKLLLDDVISETDHMCSLVQDLLLLTRLDAGELQLDYGEVQVSELVDNIYRQFRRLASSASIEFSVEGGDFTLISDQTRLRQIVLILLDNAFQHTPSGGRVSLSIFKDAHQATFQVLDTGEGIPVDQLPFVFDRFYQVDTARGGENHGSGLGLSIARSLIQALGGRIDIESEIGKGTRVRFYLPC